MEEIIPRPPKKAQTSREGPRANEEISIEEVRLIDEEGDNVGVVTIKEALERAANAGLDLLEISPNAKPPVCKIMDLGKYKYEAQKRKAEAKKKQKVINIKEIKVRPNIEDHDFDVKLKAARKFLEKGDKVKCTLRFRGREMAHQSLGFEILNRLKSNLEDISKVEQKPKLEGRQMIMVLAPE